MQERDPLKADLRDLDAHPKPPIDLEAPAEPVPEDSVDTESSGTIIRFPARRKPAGTPLVSPNVARLMLEPSTAIIIPFPVRNKPVEAARTLAVSPKIARLMRAPRRPGLERFGSGVMGREVGEADGS